MFQNLYAGLNKHTALFELRLCYLLTTFLESTHRMSEKQKRKRHQQVFKLNFLKKIKHWIQYLSSAASRDSSRNINKASENLEQRRSALESHRTVNSKWHRRKSTSAREMDCTAYFSKIWARKGRTGVAGDTSNGESTRGQNVPVVFKKC